MTTAGLLALFFDIEQLASLVSIGTLVVFTMVCSGVLFRCVQGTHMRACVHGVLGRAAPAQAGHAHGMHMCMHHEASIHLSSAPLWGCCGPLARAERKAR